MKGRAMCREVGIWTSKMEKCMFGAFEYIDTQPREIGLLHTWVGGSWFIVLRAFEFLDCHSVTNL